jgi:hypothetical protein
MEETENTIVDAVLNIPDDNLFFQQRETVKQRRNKMKGQNIYMFQRLQIPDVYIDGKKMITYIPENKQL